MKGHAELALSIFRARLSTNFTYEMVECLRFLDPSINQKTSYSQLEREAFVRKVMHYAMAMFRRRKLDVDELSFTRELGLFIGREGCCLLIDNSYVLFPRSDTRKPSPDEYMKFWSLKWAAGSNLAHFAVTLGHAAITEAAVERSFSAQVCHLHCILFSPFRQGRVYNKLRERLSEGACEAQTWLMLNHERIVNPDKAADAATKRKEKRKRAKLEAEESFNALVQKRMRPSEP